MKRKKNRRNPDVIALREAKFPTTKEEAAPLLPLRLADGDHVEFRDDAENFLDCSCETTTVASMIYPVVLSQTRSETSWVEVMLSVNRICRLIDRLAGAMGAEPNGLEAYIAHEFLLSGFVTIATDVGEERERSIRRVLRRAIRDGGGHEAARKVRAERAAELQ